jgi:hypothetical protein
VQDFCLLLLLSQVGLLLSCLLACLPCCLVSLSVEFLLGFADIAGCATIVQSCYWVCCFWYSSAGRSYSWWLGFGFRTLACAILVRLLASARKVLP